MVMGNSVTEDDWAKAKKEIEADPCKGMTAEGLKNHLNPDGYGEHTYFSSTEWMMEVKNDDSLSGYWDWLKNMLDNEEVEAEKNAGICNYTIELTRRIVVTIAAASFESALNEYHGDTGRYDDSWHHAEAEPILIGVGA